MELRRALLLFGIVLGIAAVVSVIARPASRPRDQTTPALAPVLPPAATVPTATSQPAPDSTAGVRITPKHRTAHVATNTAVTLSVAVPTAGDVELPALAMSATGEPATPAQFDLLVSTAGSYKVVIVPAGGGDPRQLGKLQVSSPR